jgi:poly(A) polymerase
MSFCEKYRHNPADAKSLPLFIGKFILSCYPVKFQGGNINKRSTQFLSAMEIVRELKSRGFIAYFVGGVVRDMLLGKTSDDIDIVTSAKPGEIVNIFPHSYEIGAAFGIINVVIDGVPFEVATFREERGYLDGRHPSEVKFTDNPETDALRRDFTINGMFYDPADEKIYDFVGGRNDLSKGILRTIGKAEARFSEDYLRILRAVRFCVRFGYALSEDIRPAISNLAGNLNSLSAERIRDEFNKMLTGPEPDRALRMMLEMGILKEVLPEIAAMDGVTQHHEYHPEGDVFEHTALMLAHMAYPDIDLAWSLLLHDVGKPLTKSMGDDGVEHFYTHEQKSAELAESILKRFRFPAKSISNIVHAVRQHMRYAHVQEMRPAKWKRLIAEETFPLELELHRIDCISSHRIMSSFTFLLDRMDEMANEIKLPPPLVTGKDLIALGMRPGPEFGEILEIIADLQLEGKITSREQALDTIVRKDFRTGLSDKAGVS